jgi:hypothetical protein
MFFFQIFQRSLALLRLPTGGALQLEAVLGVEVGIESCLLGIHDSHIPRFRASCVIGAKYLESEDRMNQSSRLNQSSAQKKKDDERA